MKKELFNTEQEALDKYNAAYNNHAYLTLREQAEAHFRTPNEVVTFMTEVIDACLDLCGCHHHMFAARHLKVKTYYEDYNLYLALKKYLDRFTPKQPWPRIGETTQ